MSKSKRVVVTGIGSINPLGNNIKSTWNALINSKSGISKYITNIDSITSRIAGTIKQGPDGFDFSKYNYNNRALSQSMKYGIAAVDEALTDAGWVSLSEQDKLETGICVGSGFGSIDDVSETALLMEKNQSRKVSPYFVSKILTNQTAGHIGIKYGFKGVNHSVSTACATGAHSIGDAMRFIQYGDAKVMVAGGTESCISPIGLIGFCRSKSLSTKYNDSPSESSRPFDKDRDGFVISEGACILILEELEHAKNRGARIYAEILGYGLSGDAHHFTSPPTDGNGASRAMRRALEVGGVKSGLVDYVNCHATSTLFGDRAENQALKSVFGENPTNLAVSSTKGATGHLLGAAGSLEAAFTVLSIFHNVLPPTLNLHKVEDEKEFNLDYVPLIARDANVDYALSNSFGFGSTNCSLLFGKYN